MIPLHAVRIDQRFNLSDGQVESLLVLRMPNDDELLVHIDDGVAAYLVDYISGKNGANGHAQPAPASPPAPAPAPKAPQLIAWAKLPDEILTPRMKLAFQRLGAPAEMNEASLVQLVRDIQERFSPEDWAELEGVLPQSKEPAKIQWADGPVSAMHPRPTKRVEKDEFGYPIVPGFDPGEVVGGEDADEDGVGQL